MHVERGYNEVGVVVTSTLPGVLRLEDSDDVGVAVTPVARGDVLTTGDPPLRAREDIPAGHKVALRNIAQGAVVRKYGWPIGEALQPIAAGAWVHVHNLRTRLRGAEQFSFTGGASRPRVAGLEPGGFLGYRRRDGRVATRNEIWILCTVGCVARTASRIAQVAGERHAGAVDGIHAFTHPFGCSQLGDDLARTRSLLAALASHPNAAGVLIVGLGCESNQVGALVEAIEPPYRDRVRTLLAQGAEDEIEAGLALVDELVADAATVRREPCRLDELAIGLKCGGSDGFSGITANPLVGRVADRCTRAGGTAILTEIPELFGAEQPLLDRAANRDVFERMVDVLSGFRRYYLDHGQPIHANPSPGNVAGGITTLEEKSLGALQKGGRGVVTQALRYAERAAGPGVVLLEAPGNDAISSTALVAAGATVILFTTGRGTPLGFPVPTLKIASNSALAARKPRWIDFDAGALLDGARPHDLEERLLNLVLETASGQRARNELNDEREIAIWKDGVTL
jgi:altronate hydrolase